MQKKNIQSKMSKKLSLALASTLDMALKRRARLIIENIYPSSGDNLLDVGCGDGYYLHLVSSLGIKNITLTGIDFDEKAIKTAKKNLANKKIQYYKVDLMKRSKLRSNSYDKVIMSEVAEHLPNDVKGLKEIYRVMKKGGTLALTVPNARYPLFWDPINRILEDIFDTHVSSGFWAGIWNQHQRLYTTDEIKRVVEKAGFTVKNIEALTYWSLPFNHYIINAGARILASGTKSAAVSGANKFKPAEHRSIINTIYFYVASAIDRLNDIWTPKDRGVGVIVVAEK